MTDDDVSEPEFEFIPEKLREVFRALWREVVWVFAERGEFKAAFGEKEAIDLMNSTAPDFFRLAQDAMIDAILLGITRLTDPAATGKYQNLSLARLVSELNPAEDAEFLSDVSSRLADAQNKTEFARLLRDKRIAHHDLPWALRVGTPPDQGIRLGDIDHALGAIADVLNAVEAHYGGGVTTHYGALFGFGDSAVLITYLRRAKEAERKERDERGWSEGEA